MEEKDKGGSRGFLDSSSVKLMQDQSRSVVVFDDFWEPSVCANRIC